MNLFLAIPLINCTPLSKSLNFSEPEVLHLKIDNSYYIELL